VDRSGALPLPGIVRRQQFADGPPRWYAHRGTVVVSGASKVEVLQQLWEQDEAALGVFVSRLSEQPLEVRSRLP
jgi:hypothetical protein